MSEHKITEVLNNGIVQRFLVPAHELDAIEQFVNKFIKVKIDDLYIIGILKRVSTVSFKPKGSAKDAEKEVYKEIIVDVEQINYVEGSGEDEQQISLFNIPDRKQTIDADVSFYYGGE